MTAIASPDLVAFLSARLDEKETAAKAAQLRFPGPWDQATAPDSPLPSAVSLYDSRDESVGVTRGSYAAAHIVLNDPDHTLRDIAAKRKILAEHKAVTKLAGLTEQELGFLGWYREWVLKNLASAWSDHPDYRQEWKP